MSIEPLVVKITADASRFSAAMSAAAVRAKLVERMRGVRVVRSSLVDPGETVAWAPSTIGGQQIIVHETFPLIADCTDACPSERFPARDGFGLWGSYCAEHHARAFVQRVIWLAEVKRWGTYTRRDLGSQTAGADSAREKARRHGARP